MICSSRLKTLIIIHPSKRGTPGKPSIDRGFGNNEHAIKFSCFYPYILPFKQIILLYYSFVKPFFFILSL